MNFLTVFILLIAEDTFDGGDVPFFAAGCQDAVLRKYVSDTVQMNIFMISFKTQFFSEKHRFYAVKQLINCANRGII